MHAVVVVVALALGAPGAGGRCPEGTRLVRGGGPFELGQLEGSREKVRDVCLDRTEVTVAAYGACVAEGRCTPAAATVAWASVSERERAEWSEHCNGARADRGEHPVNCVDWGQATAYCAARGKRLPTEAEWEWAARGGKAARRYPWGDAAPQDRVCWNVERGGAPGGMTGTCPVATHPQGDSPDGLADLGGNVWEWTASANRSGTDRVTRGGGWYYNSPDVVSARYRAWHEPSYRASTVGFRCAADPVR